MATQKNYEMAAVALPRCRTSSEYLGEFAHMKNIADMLGPKLEWNPWIERQFRSMDESRWVCWAGCAGAGKTYSAMLFGLLWWLCEPENTSVILTSTTGKALRRRAWAELVALRRELGLEKTGNFVDSKMMWQARPGDDKHAIMGLAVEDGGSVSKAVDNIKGLHTKRQLVIIDEATSTPEAVFEACVNLSSYPEDFRMLVIGNPFSRLDAMGRFAEPYKGWDSVCIEDQEWATKEKLDGEKGLVVRFDAERSPNVLANRIDFPHLISMRKLEGLRKGLGDGSPRFWSEVRGFWPPDGLVRSIMSEGELVRLQAFKKWVWVGTAMEFGAGFDPSFGGGDRAVLRFGKWGMVEGGVEGFELGDKIEIFTDAKLSDPPNFQMAAKVRKECEQRGVISTSLSVDASGGGRVFCDILEREWGPVMRVESGGKVSDRPVSHEDHRPSHEAYDRKVSELHYAVREVLMSGQLRGMDPDTAVEFCQRRYTDEKKKIVVERKDEYKKRHGKSPDLSDAVCILVEGARKRGFMVRSVGVTAARHREEGDQFKAAREVYQDLDYSGGNDSAMLDVYEGICVL